MHSSSTTKYFSSSTWYYKVLPAPLRTTQLVQSFFVIQRNINFNHWIITVFLLWCTWSWQCLSPVPLVGCVLAAAHGFLGFRGNTLITTKSLFSQSSGNFLYSLNFVMCPVPHKTLILLLLQVSSICMFFQLFFNQKKNIFNFSDWTFYPKKK